MFWAKLASLLVLSVSIQTLLFSFADSIKLDEQEDEQGRFNSFKTVEVQLRNSTDLNLNDPSDFPKVKLSQDRKPTVAFVTYELFPVTSWGGGAGVVINSLIKDLLLAGHDVIVLADFGKDYLTQWEEYRRESLSNRKENEPVSLGTLYVRHLATVLENQEIQPSKSIFMLKTRSFAMALKLIYDEIPFDFVECFDYAGVCYELLRRKSIISGVSDDYLPDTVIISIRFHGTLQFIDRAESNEVSIDVPSERSSMYLMEQFGMNSADLILCQTKFLFDILKEEYGCLPGDMIHAPAPLESILASVDEANSAVPIDPNAPSWDTSYTFLIYGRFQLVKGLEAIIHAALSLLQSSDEHVLEIRSRIKFLFVGPDMYSQEHRCMSGDYLKTLIPPEYMQNFEMHTKPINRTVLVQYSRQVRAAIFASQFESLNLAVHELARLQVPLILSKISAFQEYFSNSPQAVFFETGNSQSLKRVIRAVLDRSFDETIVKVRQGYFKLKYDDPTLPYRFYEFPRRRRRYSSKSLDLDKRIKNMEPNL